MQQFNQIYQTFSKLDLAQGSSWITVPTSDQTFNNGNWTGGFTGSANGDSTDMSIEIMWTAGAPPLGQPEAQPSRIGFSTFDSQIQFGTSNKARIFSVALEFVDITQIVNPDTGRLVIGAWMGEEEPRSATATTAGAFSGGVISTQFAPVTDYQYQMFSMGTITQSSLFGTGTTIDPVIEGVIFNFVLSPNGQIMNANMSPYNQKPAVNQAFDSNSTERSNKNGTNFQQPTSTNTIKFGAWFGTTHTAPKAGINYDFTYRLKYAYKELA